MDRVESKIDHVKNALDLACFEIQDKWGNYVSDPLQMIGVITTKESPPEFLKISGYLVSPASPFTCIGSGEPLAKFLFRSAYPPSLSHWTALKYAAYVLLNVKRHVDGCGGASQFLSVTNAGGWSDPFSQNGVFEFISEIESSFNQFGAAMTEMVSAFVAEGVPDPGFKAHIDGLANRIISIRQEYNKGVSEREEAYIEQIEHFHGEDEAT